jgi:UDP-glucose 4-epimerase
MSRLLITGGLGFIGGALCRRLAASGADLVVYDDLSTGDPARLPHGARLVEGDICDAPRLRRALAGVDGVVHLAAVSSVEACVNRRAETSRTNLHGTVTLLEETGALPVVYTSTAAVYGDQPVLPVTEDSEPDPISPYAIDKLGSERHLRAAVDLRGARGVVLRPFNVYGAGQSPESPYAAVIPRFVARAALGLPLFVNGDGGQIRDFVHVRDVADALAAAMLLALADGPPVLHTVNVCRGEGLSILALAQMVNRLAGSRAPIAFGPARIGDIRDSVGDPSRAAHLLGFSPRVDLRQGLAEMLEDDAAAPAAAAIRRPAG